MDTKCVLFYPKSFLNLESSFVLGHVRYNDNYCHVNCVLAIKEEDFNKNIYDQIRLFNDPPGDLMNGFELVGYIGRSIPGCKHYEIYAVDSQIGFCFDSVNALVQKMWFQGREVFPDHYVTVVLYIPDDVIFHYQNNSNLNSKTFTSFIYSSCKQASLLKTSNVKNKLLGEIKYCLKEIINENQNKCSLSKSKSFILNPRMQRVCSLMEKSAVYNNFLMKINTLQNIFSECSKKRFLMINSKRMLFSLLIDCILGIITMWSLSCPHVILDFGLYAVGMVVINLKTLIQWLMGVPAGLKLNQPLNHALGHFFLYHIHLWQNYVSIILPIFSFIIKIFPFFGILGLTFLIAVLQDLISLATLHIFCFYGYASKLYWCEMQGLASLWRLFRGRKWNRLRCRVDSYHYSQNQLLLGTFILTVLVFLLPTIVMYYSVFTSLRMVILAFQASLQTLTYYIGNIPLYILWMYFRNKPGLPGELHFDIISKAPDHPVILNLDMKPKSLLTSLQHYANARFPSKQKILSWKTLLNNLIWGELV